MKPILATLLLTVYLASCGVAHKTATTTNEEGYIIYRQSAPAAVLTLFGDYQLHGLKRAYLTDIHKKDLSYFTRPLQGQKPRLMFAAHTTVQPYYAAVGVQYDHMTGDTSFLAAVNESLRLVLRTGYKEVAPVTTNYGVVRGIAYQVKNPVTQRHTSHREYFVLHDGHLLRLFFWTSDRNDRILEEEGVAILKKLKFD
jgi:hypothetical protein